MPAFSRALDLTAAIAAEEGREGHTDGASREPFSKVSSRRDPLKATELKSLTTISAFPGRANSAVHQYLYRPLIGFGSLSDALEMEKGISNIMLEPA